MFKFTKKKYTVFFLTILLIIILFLFYYLVYNRINIKNENFDNLSKMEIIVNSYKDNTIALDALIKSLKECPEFNNYEIKVFVGGYYDNDKYILDKKDNNIEYILCNHNSMDFNAFIGLLEYSNIDKHDNDSFYFYLHDTCVVGKEFLKKIENIDLTNVTSLKTRNEPCSNIGVYSKKTISKFKDAIMSMKNTDETKIQSFKNLNVEKEDLIFKIDENNKLINNKDNYTTTTGPYDYYNTGKLRIVEFYQDLDLYKVKANYQGYQEKYELNV